MSNSTQSPSHVIILPYYCEEEVDRYLRIAQRLRSFPQPKAACTYLLASSPRTQTSQALIDAYSDLGKVIPFSCPSQIFGYPEGPTAMFWDCMDYLAQNFGTSKGFGLWLESDMAPVKADWLDRLSDEWFSFDQRPIMMGCYVPEVYKRRLFKKPKRILEPHINGGACYSMDFAKHMPASARDGVFDVVVYEYADMLGRAKFTQQISFSTLNRVRRDVADDRKVLLHGFMQDKDPFIDQCLKPLTERERSSQTWNKFLEALETTQRKIRVQFVRRGREAMLENMFLAKQKFEAENPEAFYQPGQKVA